MSVEVTIAQITTSRHCRIHCDLVEAAPTLINVQSARYQLTDKSNILWVGFGDCDKRQSTPVITKATGETNFPAWARLAIHDMAIWVHYLNSNAIWWHTREPMSNNYHSYGPRWNAIEIHEKSKRLDWASVLMNCFAGAEVIVWQGKYGLVSIIKSTCVIAGDSVRQS